MVCSECGTIIDENKNVCSKCGTKVTELAGVYEKELIEEKGLSTKNYEIKENKIMLKLGDKYISFYKNADKTIFFNMIEKIGEKYGEDFSVGLDKKIKNFEDLLEYLNEEVLEKYNVISEIIKDRGEKWGYKNFESLYQDELNVTELKIYPIINYLKVVYEDANKKVEEGHEKRLNRKESRELSYADENDTSAIIKAKAKNKASGAFHSLLNGMGNVKTNIEVKLELKKVYESKDQREKIKKAIENDIKEMATIAMKLINDKYKDEILKELYSEEDKKDAINSYIQLGDMENDEERLDCIRNVIQKYGEFEGIYIDALALYKEGIDGLETILNFFYFDVKEVKSKAKKRRDEIDKLTKCYGKKGMYIGKCLERNSIFDKYKFKMDSDLNVHLKKVGSKLKKEYIYLNDEELSKENLDIAILALEEYCFLKEELPLFLYNYESTYKNVDGILITDKTVHYKDKEGKPSSKEIENLKFHSVAYNKETRKIFIENESTNIFIEKEEDAVRLIDILTYFIMMIKYKDSINENFEFMDEAYLERKFFNDYRSLEGYKLEEKEMLEKNLKRNSLYHKVKNDFSGDLIHDINIAWGDRKPKKLWNLNYLGEEAIREKTKEKLEKAKETYNIYDEKALILYDNTLLGTSKEGFIITDSSIIVKEGVLGKTISMSLDKYTNFTIKEDKIIFSNETILDLSNISDKEKIEIKRIMDIILNLILVRF